MSTYLGFADFTHQQHLIYPDYLQARQFEGSIRFGIREQTKALIATNAELAQAHYDILEASRTGTATLARSLSDIGRRLDSRLEALEETFNWGFSEVLIVIGRLADKLEELVRIAKTPEQTWAYEQFSNARDELRRHLYPEAVTSVTRAISGYGGHTGYQSEFRFHYLLGLLRLGSFSNTSPEVVSLAAAETAFAAAHRYGVQDYPEEASFALLGAGRAAYASGNLDGAIAYLSRALTLFPNPEKAYEYAKVLAAKGRIGDALPSLERAIRADFRYALQAAGDGDFARHETAVQKLIQQLHAEARQTTGTGVACLRELTRQVKEYRVDVGAGKHWTLSEHAGVQLQRFNASVENAISSARVGTLAANIKFMESLPELQHRAVEAVAACHETARQGLLEERDKLALKASEGRPSRRNFVWLFGILGVGSLCFNIVSCGENARFEGEAAVMRAIWGVAITLGAIVVASVLQARLNAASEKKVERARQHQKDRALALEQQAASIIKMEPSWLELPNLYEGWKAKVRAG
jgi:tetratricopeptide (TPR) repeat protein